MPHNFFHKAQGLLQNPIQSFRDARQPGGFLAPSENFRGYFTNPMAHAGSLILQGVPVGQALMQGPLQAFDIQEKFQGPVSSYIYIFWIW